MRAYTRIGNAPLELHSGIYEPDIVVVIDPSMQNEPSIFAGLKKNGTLVINAKTPSEKVLENVKNLGINLWMVDAYKIAMEVFGRPFYNTPMLGALVKASNIVSLDSVLSAVSERFSKDNKIAQLNVLAIKRAYEEVKKYE